MGKFLVFLILGILPFSFAFASSPFTNLETYKESLGFNKIYKNETPSRRLKVAVFDKGFYGYKEQIGVTLPRSTRYVAGPVAEPDDNKVEHGLRMAQILIGMMTDDLNHADWVPEFALYNVYGYSNFKAAVDDVIAKKYDVVLYSEVWEYGGNSDGKGFINRQVSRATKAGILWVNAAGNFGLTTYNSYVQTVSDSWIKLPDRNNGLEVVCEKTKSGKCPVKIVLSWNDFKDDVELGTDKDLDIALTDDFLNVVQSSSLKQSADPKEERPGHSKYPREIISAELTPGTYYLRVKNRSNNFGSKDRLRITVDGDGLKMPSHSKDSSLLNPADNPSVITVGASDSDRSSVSASLKKPDLLAPSSISLADTDEEFRGSSNSAAIVAAGVAMVKAMDPSMNRSAILKRITRGGGSGQGGDWSKTGLSLAVLGFSPANLSPCFQEAKLNNPPDYVKEALSKGGVPVQTTFGIRIMVPFDPVTLEEYLVRINSSDMIVALPDGGYTVFTRRGQVPQGAVEIFQRPIETGLCRSGGNSSAKSFSLF